MEEDLVVQEQYLKALDLLQTPSTDAHQEADALLAQLGLSWRLSDAVWAACSTPCLNTSPPTKTSEHQAASFPFSGTDSSCPKGSQLVNRPAEEQNQEQPFLNTPIIFAPPDDLQAVQRHKCNLKPGGRQDPAGHMSELDPGHMSELNPGHSPPLGAPSLLPASLLSALQAAFDPHRSPFWADHAYHDPDTPFFSYVHDLRQPPSNIVELAAQSMWEGLCRLWDVEVPWKLPGGYACPKLQPPSATVPMHPAPSSTTGVVDRPYSRVTHVEWWAHTRPPDGFGHQLHFDCDETMLRKEAAGYRLVHPCLSSVVFLSGGRERGFDDSRAVTDAAKTCNTSSSARNMGTECSDRVDRGKGVSGPDVGPPTVVLDQWPGMGLVAPTPQIHSPRSRPAPAAPVAAQFHSPASKPAPPVTAAAGPDTALDEAALKRSTGIAEVHVGEAGRHSFEVEERGEMGCEGGKVPAASTAAAAAAAAAAGAGSAEEEGRQYLAERCWLVHPKAGQVLLFPGNLLHGVLPHRPLGVISTPPPSQTWPDRSDRSGEQGSRAPGRSCPRPCLSTPEGDQPAKEQAQRTTLIFAWWAEQGPGEIQQQQQHQLQPQQQQQEVHAQGDAPRAQALCPQQVPPTRAWLSQASQHAQRLVHRSRQRAAAKTGGAATQGKRAQGEGAISSPSLYAREKAGSREEACEGGSAKRQKLGHQGNGEVHGNVSTEQWQHHLEAGAHERRLEWSTSQTQTDGNRRSEDPNSSSSSSSSGGYDSSSGSSEMEGSGSNNSEETSSESDKSKEARSARLLSGRSSLPRWCQYFIDLMLSVQSLPDASHTRPPASWTLPPPISPAWSLIKSKGRSQEEMSLASLEAIPDLRFCIPRLTYFNELYPVDAKVGSASICGV